ncbi:MAG: beta-glucosidase [Candidatus Doudnabacteria bacterium]|nr:beta-glucosidase [Candidatus Doudnabacteria bacterium]
MQLKFPQGFLWGSATAAHQIEGNNTNSDWWQWENSPQRLSELQKQNKNLPKNLEDYKSGIACDSYNRYEEDFDVAKSLNQNAHRLSIEWARIEPFQGEFDQEQIEHYRKVLKALRARGIKTFVTLHHFTNPVWFMEIGGWTKHQNLALFLRYAQKVLTELKDDIDFVCVINEPNVYAVLSYWFGMWPPQKKNYFLSRKIQQNMLEAHIKVYQLCKILKFPFEVGSAYHIRLIQIEGLFGWLEPWIQSILTKYIYKTAKYSDFIGINYYTRTLLVQRLFPFFFGVTKEKINVTDFNWEIYPKGLYLILKDLKQYKKPIYITENGIADAADHKRAEYIKTHLTAVHQAIDEGVDVRGYLHWSLLDNFEWAAGYTMKFGLVEIDRQNNLKRIVRESANYYAEICKNNYLETETK